MVSAPITGDAEAYGAGEAGHTLEASTSGISWPAIFGGAFATAASSLILLALGSGFGLASVSPWSNSGASATTFTVLMAIWLIIVQWLSSGLGGYLTGRLRTKWVGVHTHEVFFRDTAHGFLAWAVAAVVGAAVLASVASSLLSGSAHGSPTVASGAAEGASQGAVQANPSAYYVDSLFRSDSPECECGRSGCPGRGHTHSYDGDQERHSSRRQDLSCPARGRAHRSFPSRCREAGRRGDCQGKSRRGPAARKAGAYLSIFTALSMLIGAFIAAAAGALGGHHRDEDWRVHSGALP